MTIGYLVGIAALAVTVALALWGRRPIPRSHPFGDGTACDACDKGGALYRHSNGGWYCEACTDEVQAVFGFRRMR